MQYLINFDLSLHAAKENNKSIYIHLIAPEAKWPPFCRRYLQFFMKCLCFHLNFTEMCSRRLKQQYTSVATDHYSDVIMSAMASQITDVYV